jgi:hypothetical protein
MNTAFNDNMLGTLVQIVGSIIEILSKSGFEQSKRKTIGRTFAKLHMGLSEIIEDGEKILQVLGNQEKEIDAQQLINLVSLQAGRIRNMRSLIEKSNIATILGIHLPQLEDLQVLLERKGHRIAVLAEQFEQIQAMRRGFNYIPPEHLLRSHSLDRWVTQWEIIRPTEDDLKKGYKILDELRKRTETLREFLVDNFEIAEIV